MALSFDAWFGPLQAEYLDTYIPQGGGAVRFAVAREAQVGTIKASITTAARAAGLHVVDLDTAQVKLHMLQTAFFAIVASLDWDALVQARLEALVDDAGYQWPAPGRKVTLPALAAHNGVAPNLLRTTMQQQFTHAVWNDARLAQDFRKAMISLLESHMTDDENGMKVVVMEWLRGELRQAWLLRTTQISGKINRQNARAMLVSLCHWLQSCGQAGIVVLLDVRQMLRERRELADGLAYTPAAVMDCYEVIRQVIDDAEHYEGLMMVVLGDLRLINDDVPKRALTQYAALKMRVWDDVRPHGRDNPLAPLVLLEA